MAEFRRVWMVMLERMRPLDTACLQFLCLQLRLAIHSI